MERKRGRKRDFGGKRMRERERVNEKKYRKERVETGSGGAEKSTKPSGAEGKA